MASTDHTYLCQEQEKDEEFDTIVAATQARRTEQADAIIAARDQHIVVPPLTEGKTHHLFISNDEQDSDWTHALIKTLEEERGLKCMWYKRDFKDGRTLVSNIDHCIITCMKSLFIISPDFVKSDWCMQEIDWAVGMSVANRECQIVPLLLKQCKIPSIFKTFHYIDVPGGDDYIDRIVRSFDPEDDLQRMDVSYVQFLPQKGSGLSTSIYANKDVSSRIRGSSWSFRELASQGRTQINGLGSKFADDVYYRASQIVNESTHLRYYSLGICSCQRFWFLVCIMAVVILLMMLIGILILHLTQEFSKTNYLHIALWPILMIIPVLNGVSRKLSYRKICKEVVNLSIDNVKETNVLVYYWNGSPYWKDTDSPYLQVMYYDVHPCLDYMTKEILKKTTDLHEDMDQAKALARLMANNKMISYLRNKLKGFMLLEIRPESVTRRHHTYLNKMCLCERIEINLGF